MVRLPALVTQKMRLALLPEMVLLLPLMVVVVVMLGRAALRVMFAFMLMVLASALLLAVLMAETSSAWVLTPVCASTLVSGANKNRIRLKREIWLLQGIALAGARMQIESNDR